ncbi:hypothetical protein [Priestia megaterium]|uniref:hypothetical protein n=1 Tax=Priestia megaterium TaxID=1404 RepID=UPI000BF82B2F|nr:hypothetical protein [Priestia megaterium]PFJ03215.1 hypothetical protein COI84_02690 [Priestia megaterium]PGR11750.1 hypothetical protein COC62_14095 [Priestia megaterium]
MDLKKVLYTLRGEDRFMLPQFFRKSDGEPVLLEGEQGLYVQPITEVKDVILQEAAETSNDGEPFNVGSFRTITQRISGTATNRTIIFEFSMDGQNWEECTGMRLNGMEMSSQVTGNNETWSFEVPGIYQFRARVAEVIGGNVTVKGTAVT